MKNMNDLMKTMELADMLLAEENYKREMDEDETIQDANSNSGKRVRRPADREQRLKAAERAKQHLAEIAPYVTSVKRTRNGAYIHSKHDGTKEYEKGDKLYSRKIRHQKIDQEAEVENYWGTEEDWNSLCEENLFTEEELNDLREYDDYTDLLKEACIAYDSPETLLGMVLEYKEFIESEGLDDRFSQWKAQRG